MISATGQEIFDAELARLYAGFAAAPKKEESDDELADAILTLILRRARAQQGATYKRRLWPEIDSKTLSRMATWDTNDPALSTIEKVFKRLAAGRGDDAVTLLQASLQASARAKLDALSKRQSEIAKKPRKPHSVVALIDKIVAANPSVNENQLLQALKRLRGDGVIDEITDSEIIDTDGVSISVSGLKDQLSRAKKRYSR